MKCNKFNLNKTIDEIISKKHIIKQKRKIDFIINYCQRNNKSEMLKAISISILLIETYYRSNLFRLAEYIIVTLESIFSILFNRKVKNYTIGCFQLGLSYILKYNNYNIYEHVNFINKINLFMLLNIFSAFYYKENIKIALWKIESYYNKLYKIDSSLVVRRVGEKYNGTYEYGILVEKVYNEIKMLF